MGSLFDLYDQSGNLKKGSAIWRKDLLPASYRGALFYCESGSRENGRRIVNHEFPKKEQNYAEDMGKRALAFSVRAYCVQYPSDEKLGNGDFVDSLKRMDYRIARDQLMAQLEQEGSGVLQLPTLPPVMVVVDRYRLTEEEKFGGYCIFDISFIEAGKSPFDLTPEQTATDQAVLDATKALRDIVLQTMVEQFIPQIFPGPQGITILFPPWAPPANPPLSGGSSSPPATDDGVTPGPPDG